MCTLNDAINMNATLVLLHILLVEGIDRHQILTPRLGAKMATFNHTWGFDSRISIKKNKNKKKTLISCLCSVAQCTYCDRRLQIIC